ncbi:GlxA family transcriptional regulator [Arthrobacter sp. AZCC_0090]|uniref:GlxA family transcriptional regulator n=1 Tax=Arthrobacter sp. AZCC_0090 TaxID=2735881 RepID=UPI00184052E8|nr:helix-turn-helix domain-containing protein [Arthrobacter sp. AZCC_0090]MBB6403750.1 transcriptional regulator GlxA family with amidase domain [Arthrobacter sp. AZCC_0090]
MMLHRYHKVAVLAMPGMSPFHLAVPQMVFEDPPPSGAAPRYQVKVFTPYPGRVRMGHGPDMVVEPGLETIAWADTVVLPSWDPDVQAPGELLDAIRTAHENGSRIVSLCLGAFLLAATGLLDGREAVTHWGYSGELQQRYPAVRVVENALWADHDDVVSSAGVAAGLDCCIHLLRKDFGSDAADRVARGLVMAPHRNATQAQFIPARLPRGAGHDGIERAMTLARENLSQPIGLDQLAAAASMSRRTFTRHFRSRTGATVLDWLTQQRLDHARTMLESSHAGIEEIGASCGFGSTAAFRQHFRSAFGNTPSRYREEFAS